MFPFGLPLDAFRFELGFTLDFACGFGLTGAFFLAAPGVIFSAKDDATEDETEAFPFLDLNTLFGATKVRRLPFCAITARA
jgi:hypothetical protein